jgi:LysM repeat protein
MKRRYALKKKKRFYSILSVFVIIAVIIIAATNVYSEKPENFKTVKVKSGDTLWSIAESCGISKDTRLIVREIRRINGLDESIIYAGMEIKVPIY